MYKLYAEIYKMESNNRFRDAMVHCHAADNWQQFTSPQEHIVLVDDWCFHLLDLCSPGGQSFVY
jgi:hypothetical protein